MLNPVLLTLFYVSGVLSGLLGPCNKKDSACFQKTFSEVLPTVIGGIESRGIASSDPLFQDIIEGDLSIFKFTFKNTTVTGFKNCVVSNTKFNVDALKLSFDMNCKNISLSGDYEMSGKLIILPVEGKGTYNIVTSSYFVSVDTDLKLTKCNDGKSCLNIKNFNLKPEATGPIKFDFKNLFNGQKDLSDAVHKFAHENDVEIADFVQHPIFNKNFKSIISNVNKFLKTEPLEEMLID